MARRALKPPPDPTPPPTPEQEHILDLVLTTKDNLLINSLAGSGKTTMLRMIQEVLPPPILCLAFNVNVAAKMKEEFLSTTTVKTFNGLGHTVWQGTIGRQLKLDKDQSGRVQKVPNILREIIRELPRGEQGEAWEVMWDVASAIGLAKSLGYVPTGKYPNSKRLIEREAFYAHITEDIGEIGPWLLEEALFRSIKAAYSGLIDYNDQVYMPAVFGGRYPVHPHVLIDETQDLSPVNHEMLAGLRHSRLIGVGDPWQSIYAFRGAVTNGMMKMRERFAMVEADLSVSFRCPETVVRAVHWRVPKMKWIKGGGRVGQLRNPTSADFHDGCAIICRNNAPLFALALKLLAHGRSVSVAGSDVGPRVIGILRKIGNDNLQREALLEEIEKWRMEKVAKGSTTAQDIAECMRVFAHNGLTLGQAVAYAEHLFRQQGTIQLLTGHKAKGLEWDTVYHLDPWLLRADEQDLNLRYVITTRAKETYYEINSQDIRWPDDVA